MTIYGAVFSVRVHFLEQPQGREKQRGLEDNALWGCPFGLRSLS